MTDQGVQQTIGQILKQVREARDLSPDEVLEDTGVSNEYLRRLEADEIKKPSASVLWILCEYYNIDFKPIGIMAGIIIKKQRP
jgi:transcriptional regulator with XRE-family HTH domain